MERCGKHVSEQRGFCALEKGHKDSCSKRPRAKMQGVRVPFKKKLIPAHTVKEFHPELAQVACLGATVGGNGCGATLLINTLVYIQTHWYVEPYGCTGGDYWNQGEGRFVCPKCGAENRLYERPEVEKLKQHFKEVKNVYER